MRIRLHDGAAPRELVSAWAAPAPAGTARAWGSALEEAGLTLSRARVAARLGLPDPFGLREAVLGAPPDARVEVLDPSGAPLTPDSVLAALVAALDADPSADADLLPGLLAHLAPGPCVRAVVSARALPGLRWRAHGNLHADAPPRGRTGEVLSWTTQAIGDDPVATVRAIAALPDGTVALGSDYGLTLAREGGFTPFPWPAGARREARRVEAMAVHGRQLLVATTQALYTAALPLSDGPSRGQVTSRRHPADREDGYDDLNALCSVGGRLLEGWRTRLVGGEGPRDVLSFAVDPAGVVYAGTRHGDLHVVDGASPVAPGPLRSFGVGKPRPVRHLAFARGALWVAADGALHRFDGAAWSTLTPEPTALCVDGVGRLWVLAEGALWCVEGPPGAEVLQPQPVALERPWALGAVDGALWVGGRERIWRVALP
jgi:hypothetical protein